MRIDGSQGNFENLRGIGASNPYNWSPSMFKTELTAYKVTLTDYKDGKNTDPTAVQSGAPLLIFEAMNLTVGGSFFNDHFPAFSKAYGTYLEHIRPHNPYAHGTVYPLAGPADALRSIFSSVEGSLNSTASTQIDSMIGVISNCVSGNTINIDDLMTLSNDLESSESNFPG